MYGSRSDRTRSRNQGKTMNKNEMNKERRRLTRIAIMTGKLVKPDTCKKCGIEPSGVIKRFGDNTNLLHFHHHHLEPEFYLIGIWVCFLCHVEIHNEIREKNRLLANDSFETKKCEVCKEKKLLCEFRLDKRRNWRNTTCRICVAKKLQIIRDYSSSLSDKELLNIVNDKFYYEKGKIFRKTTSGGRLKGSEAGHLNKEGYLTISISGRKFQVSNIVFLIHEKRLPRKEMVIDHVNHIKSDNRIENLKEMTYEQNGRNLPLFKNNTSGVTGIAQRKGSTTWRASIRFNGSLISLGEFNDRWGAICARKSAENKYGFTGRAM